MYYFFYEWIYLIIYFKPKHNEKNYYFNKFSGLFITQFLKKFINFLYFYHKLYFLHVS